MSIINGLEVLPRDQDLVVFMLSGGVDSSALLFDSLQHVKKPHGLFLDLGQKSGPRQEAAVRRLGMRLGVPITVADLQGMAKLYLPMSEPPHPMVAETGTLPTLMKPRQEEVDSCKAVTIAASFAALSGAEQLYYGATSEDVSDAPNLLKMISGIENVVQLNTGRTHLTIESPFSKISRADALARLPMEYHAMTWSCHWGGLHHCGQCVGCLYRKERFTVAGAADPTCYSMEYLA